MSNVMSFKDDCVFCRIMRGDIPGNKVYEDSFCYAFRDINPQAPTHILVVPRDHIGSLAELKREDAHIVGHIFSAIAKIARDEGVSESGYRVITNNGPDAGQTVPHLHFHLLAGKQMGEKMV